jgi:hypothetical protein
VSFFSNGRQVVLAVEQLNVRDQLRPLSDEETPSPQEVAGLAFGGGVDVGEWKVAAAEETGESGGILAVVLGFAAVNGFHGEGVAEDEGDASRSHRSASQYQANIHSQPTTSPGNGVMASRKAAG